MSLTLLRRFARNNAWANHRLYEACARLSQAELTAPRTSFFPTIFGTLNHILVVDWYYIDALCEEGRAMEIYAVFDQGDPYAAQAPLRAAQQASDAKLTGFCDRLTEADAARSVTLHRPGDRFYLERIDDVLAHLFQHQVHHRGQVHAMLAGTAVPPPQLDEFFLGQDAPFRGADLDALGWPEERPIRQEQR